MAKNPKRASGILTSDKINKTQNVSQIKQITAYSKTEQKPVSAYNTAFVDLLTNESDYYTYTVVKSNICNVGQSVGKFTVFFKAYFSANSPFCCLTDTCAER